MFTKQSLDYIRDNEYKVKQEGQRLHFKHYSSGRLFVLFIGIICILSSLFIALFDAWALILTAFIIGITINEFIKRRSKHQTTIDFQKLIFEYSDPKNPDLKRHFKDIKHISTTSELLGSYASADKSTTDEYRVTLQARLDSGEVINLFQFNSDYEMEDAIAEIEQTLNDSVAKAIESA